MWERSGSGVGVRRSRPADQPQHRLRWIRSGPIFPLVWPHRAQRYRKKHPKSITSTVTQNRAGVFFCSRKQKEREDIIISARRSDLMISNIMYFWYLNLFKSLILSGRHRKNGCSNYSRNLCQRVCARTRDEAIERVEMDKSRYLANYQLPRDGTN